jgi:adenylate kinase family enzyme
MSHRIHVFGASGSGTTTLGAAVASAIGARSLDADAYYWFPTDPPFTHKREPADRIALIERDLAGVDDWVLTGSICSWGDAFIARFGLAVFLHLAPDVRMARLAARERARYGERIGPGGDMEAAHRAFMDWARSYDHARAPVRSLDLHERWMTGLGCPVLRLDARRSVEELRDLVVTHARSGHPDGRGSPRG